MPATPWSDIIAALITGVLVPEIAALIRRHQQANGPGSFPTDAEIIAELNARCDDAIARGQAFLDDNS